MITALEVSLNYAQNTNLAIAWIDNAVKHLEDNVLLMYTGRDGVTRSIRIDDGSYSDITIAWKYDQPEGTTRSNRIRLVGLGGPSARDHILPEHTAVLGLNASHLDFVEWQRAILSALLCHCRATNQALELCRDLQEGGS
jgi:hypothetical protein